MLYKLRNNLKEVGCRIILSLLFSVVLLQVSLEAQQTVLHQDAEIDFRQLVKEYDQGLYGRCIRSAEKFLTRYSDPVFRQFVLEAELLQMRAALRLQQPGIQARIFVFVEQHQPSAVAQQALMLLGEDAYDRKEYDEAIRYLSMVDSRVLTGEERSALYFKLGYSLFVRKEFDQAASLFGETKDVRDKYYYPSNYYYGMSRYFQGDYTEAIRSFERVIPSTTYKDYVPYYITQIHFSQKEYPKVIGYGNQSLQSPSVLNKTDIRQLVGQAYFETGDFASAIPHLEYVEKQSAKWRTDDFYQLGMAYYHTGQYAAAIPMLAQIRNEKGVKSHYANYYLGQCYLKTGDKKSARNSLMNASKMDDVPALAIEATFHYGRLAAEAGDDVEAIRVLQSIPSTSVQYGEAQQALANILIQTQDYGLAIREMEAMSSLSPTLKGAYQKVCLYRAEQLIQEGKLTAAIDLLDKALKYPIDKSIEARTYFWKGEIAHHASEYQQSIRWYDQYFRAAGSNADLPLNQSLPAGLYNQAYNYLRLTQYVEAQKLFEESIAGIDQLPAIPGQSSLLQYQVYPDALLRAGDCAFKRNQYDKANQWYDKSIGRRLPGNDYAEYQKAIIKGLQRQPGEKIRLMEKLARDLPESVWADDALYQAGITYQDENQIAKAIQSYELLVSRYKDKSPLLLPALLRLGLLHYNSGQFEKALVHYKSVFQYNPDPETAREAMSAIQEIYVTELEKPDAYFQFAGSIPGYSVTGTEKDSILYSAAENHYAQAQYEKAAEAFERYIASNPSGLYTLKARYLRAESLSLLKRYTDALAAYESVIAQGQSAYYATSLYKAALIAYHQVQDMTRAYQYYSTYIPLATSDDQSFEATMGALRSAYRLKNADQVYAMSAKVLQHVRVTDDLIALAHFYTATMAFVAQDLDKALTAYNAVIRFNSADLAAESRYHIALIYQRRSEPEIASKLAEEAARANVGYPVWVAKSLILLSDISFEQGDLLNARAILEAILEHFQGDETLMSEASEKLERVKREEENVSRIKTPQGDQLELQPLPKKD